MGGPVGNKHAEKYTEKMVEEIFQKSLEELQSNRNIIYLGELAEIMDLYSDWYKHQLYRLKDNKVLPTLKEKIDSLLATRLFTLAAWNRVNPTIAIFGLKNNHGWKDKQEQEVYGKDGKDLIPTYNIKKVDGTKS